MPDGQPEASTGLRLTLADVANVAQETAPAGEEPTKKRDAEARREFLALAKRRFRTCADSENVQRNEIVEDQRFRSGKQWPDQIIAMRELDKRPCLTINRLGQPIGLIQNQQRQSKVGIRVSPVDNVADPETAEVFEGLIRHIEVQSQADVAYDTAFERTVEGGIGWFRCLTEYLPGSFDQEIKIKRILNPLRVYVDPSAEEIDYSDARFMFITVDFPKDEFKETYGDARAVSLEEFSSLGDHSLAIDWFPEGRVRVAEYWYVEETERKLVLIDLGAGQTRTVPAEEVPEGAVVKRTRVEKVRKVKCAIINAADVLEEHEWAGQWIPFVPVIGTELVVEGKRQLRGIVRDARDPQRMYNYWVTAATEQIALAKRAQVVGAEGQFEGHEKEWNEANLRNLPYLEYKPVTVSGQIAPPPQIQSVEPPIQAMMVAVKQADNDLKATTGLFDASLGERGPQQSGKAIAAVQRQGELSTSGFTDNLSRAITHLGRILIDLIPKIYDAPRILRIIGADNIERSVSVNQNTIVNGVQRIYDLTVGRYDVTVSTGPAYNTRREASAAGGMELIQAAPALMGVIGDLVVGDMPWPNAPQMAERMKKVLPPQLQDKPGDQGQQLPPQVQAQMDALMQQHAQLTEALNAAQQELTSKKMELDSRERIARMQADVTIAVTQARNESAEQIALLRADVDQIKARADAERGDLADQTGRVHERMMAGEGRQHERLAAGEDRTHERGMTRLEQQHQRRMATEAASREDRRAREQRRFEAKHPPKPAPGKPGGAK